jgi:hypothetical protein
MVGFREAKPILVGGQAVNLWAQIYAASLPSLRAFEPYTSTDADLFGSANMAFVIARRCGWEFTANADPASIIAATLAKTTPAGAYLEIDVLRDVPGVSEAELQKTAGKARLAPDKYCYLPAPSVLLKAKIANLNQLGGQRSDGSPRNDFKHAGMLLEICPHYIRHMARSIGGDVTEQSVINELNYLHSVVNSAGARLVAARHGIPLKQAVPKKLDAKQYPRLAACHAGCDSKWCQNQEG